MQQVQNTKNPGEIAFRYGLIAGAVFIVQQVVILVITRLFDAGFFGLVLGVLNFLLSIALFLVTGLLAARQTGLVSSGTLAGLFAGCIGGLVSLGTDLLITWLNIDALRQRAQQAADFLRFGVEYTNTTVFASMVFGSVVGLLLTVALSVGLGALGGLIGRNKARLQAPPYTRAPFPTPPS